MNLWGGDTMFLDNRQVAIDSTLKALAESLDFFYDNTSRLQASIREELTPIYEERREKVFELERLCREQLKMLPHDVDIERDDYRWLWSRLKVVVSGSYRWVLNGLYDRERAVLIALAKGMSHPLPSVIDNLLVALFNQSHDLLRSLYEAQHEFTTSVRQSKANK